MTDKYVKTIGIVGGAGPMAGCLMMQRIIEICQSRYGCIEDADFPKVLLYSFPFAQMLKPNSQFQRDGLVKSQLNEAINFLIKSGCDYIIITCNTLHGYLEQGYTNDSTIIDLVAETTSVLNSTNQSQTVVLCTQNSVLNQVYDLSNQNLLDRDDQLKIDLLIAEILCGKVEMSQAQLCLDIAKLYYSQSAVLKQLVLGCTELSVLSQKFPILLDGIDVYDPMTIVADKVCRLCFRDVDLEVCTI